MICKNGEGYVTNIYSQTSVRVFQENSIVNDLHASSHFKSSGSKVFQIGKAEEEKKKSVWRNIDFLTH